ncbi:hypothetical protein NM688_g6893 [Phlebia brevispora]|uniref:Uncharacterized protein n=1 Tax=Phlebia brevispora TaxID=194682 RepID=A0ACC1SB69_9APHY|nr:hypothetical protein NM688_g6893 [Phlebia brevispora]
MAPVQFPTEILDHLLDWVLFCGNRPTVQSCSLVHSRWRDHSQRFLFAEIVLQGERGATDFSVKLRWLVNHPRVAKFVKKLVLRGTVGIREHRVAVELERDLVEAFLHVLPNVESLTISQCRWTGNDSADTAAQFSSLTHIVVEDVECDRISSNVLQVLTFAKDVRDATISRGALLREVVSRNTGSLEQLDLSVAQGCNVGWQREWEGLHLRDCVNLRAIDIAFSLDKGPDVDDGDPAGISGQRARALAALLCQIPMSIQNLSLQLYLNNSQQADGYQDMARVDWAAVGRHTDTLVHTFSFDITLHGARPFGGFAPSWMPVKMDLIFRNIRNIDVASVEVESENVLQMFYRRLYVQALTSVSKKATNLSLVAEQSTCWSCWSAEKQSSIAMSLGVMLPTVAVIDDASEQSASMIKSSPC